ncbi:hypothetical protein HHK36_029046 [Tetracentron sinense]|uniref:Protein LURP-one-related 17 n=1 Tax=Tetracentron sinense TaxID=13715 RepID=A0A834YIH6_TETSI|nr:hypothetical protein HHK36_029046 [Tetracentron sinense]
MKCCGWISASFLPSRFVEDESHDLDHKSTSRRVHVGGGGAEQECENEEGACTSLTVWRKSLVFSCNGFTVIDSDGNLVYRVDNYMGGGRDEVVLMDASGKPVLTMRRKKLRLLENWLVYDGEVEECGSTTSPKKPICCVRKHVNLLQANPQVLAHVCREYSSSSKRLAYVIEGSYGKRSCRVLDESRRVVAEIKRKEAMIGGISFGVEVFLLVVREGFDTGFAMAMVLLLDQMFS